MRSLLLLQIALAGCAHAPPPKARTPSTVGPSAEVHPALSSRITDPELLVRQRCPPAQHQRLVRATYRLDGELVFQRVFDQTRPPGVGLVVLEGRVAPGKHLLAVQLEYQGNRRGSLASPSDDYRVTASGERGFVLGEGEWLEITVRGEEPPEGAAASPSEPVARANDAPPSIAFEIGFRPARR